MVDEARKSSAFGEGATVPGARLQELPSGAAFLKGMTECGSPEGVTRVVYRDLAYALMAHMHYALNFELHRRKVFWVDESLAWMLANTSLDIDGAALELPFPCFALAFQDEATMALVRAHAEKTDPKRVIGTLDVSALKSLTVYVTRGARSAEHNDIDLSFVSETCESESRLPYLVLRNLHVRPGDDLDKILESDIYEAEWSGHWRPERGTPELKRLVHLVLNAILYATSASEAWPVLQSPAKALSARVKGFGKKRQDRAATRAAELRKAHSNESVFVLPGKIPITRLRQLRDMERSSEGRELFSRFMVRGHWRRPATTWSDQRLRWIEPYWKGPEMATIIEREYRMTM